MEDRHGTEMGRRHLVVGGLALSTTLAAPAILRAQPAPRPPTPAQTAGPFYPATLPSDIDSDLVVLRGAAARAEGTVAHVGGRVLDRDGRPIPGAIVEIWQCDARGRYRHPGDVGGRPRDTAFQGFGRTAAGPDGSYAFRTIKPVAYPGRTPHIHVLVRAPGRRLVTQLYVAGDPLNEADGLYASLGRARDAVTVRLAPANGIEAGALAGEFDIVL